jgi:hypothetical protein
MWLLVLLVAVSVVVTVAARRRHADERDSVDAQQRRIDALRTAVTQSGEPTEPGTFAPRSRPRADRPSARSVMATALVAIAVVVAGISIYAIAAGWNSGSSQADDGDASSPSPRASSTTTSSLSTTTTTKPVVPTVLSSEGGTVVVSVPSGPYQVRIAANDPCWTQAERADGTVVDTQTLEPGGAMELNETGALTVRLGNPAGVEFSVNGTVLALPPATGDAFEVSLVPAT